MGLTLAMLMVWRRENNWKLLKEITGDLPRSHRSNLFLTPSGIMVLVVSDKDGEVKEITTINTVDL